MNTGHKERGIVFVSALVMMTMLLATGLGYMVMVRTEINITKNYIDEIKLLTDIESCVERAIGKIANDEDANETVSTDSGMIHYKYDPAQCLITSTLGTV